jgi:uncharacterized protein (TIGR02996 family)
MSDEAAFLRAIQANPTDATAKLVYADWLDEHGESEKAEYLRLSERFRGKRIPDSESRRLYQLERQHRVWLELMRGGAIIWDEVTLYALGRLRGLLDVFAGLNGHASDISYDFDADLVPLTGTIAEVVNGRFGNNPNQFELERLPDWEASLRDALREWLFHELRHLTPPRYTRLAFLTEDGRERVIDDALTHVRAVIRPTTGWRLVLTGGQRNGIDWADLALEAPDRVLFLHFSYDD